MRFEWMSLTYFKSFEETQEIYFDDYDIGLFFLHGINEKNEKLGSNASGKSTLWDALCWCLYGKTARSLKASSVGNWSFNEQCVVQLKYVDVDNIKRHLKRTWNPNKLCFITVNGESNITQQRVEDSLRLSFNAFLNTVLIGQFGEAFLDLKPAVRERVFAEVMDLDYWLLCSDKASKKASVLSKEVQKLQVDLARLQGEYKSIFSLDYSSDLEEWEKSKNSKIRVLKSDLKSMGTEHDLSEKKITQLRKEVRLDSENEKASKLEFSEINDRLDGLNSLHLELQIGLSKLRTVLDNLKSRYNSIKHLATGKCTLCNQPISKKHLQFEISTLKVDINKQERLVGESVGKLNTCLTRKKKVEKIKKRLIVENRSISETIYHKRNKIDSLLDELGRSEQRKRKLKDELSDLSEMLNPFIAKNEKLEKNKARLNYKLSASKVRLNEVKEKASIVKYWVTGFKLVRLLLIKESLRQLQIEINESIIQLGLDGWSIELSTDKFDKKGNITGKGFQIYVKSPESPSKVLWESWSGGESQRLRIAGTIGLSTLIKSRFGVFPNIEVWDEPSTWLSEEGVLDLLELLYYRANEESLQLWLVDHTFVKYAGFKDKLLVVNTKENGSILVHEND